MTAAQRRARKTRVSIRRQRTKLRQLRTQAQQVRSAERGYKKTENAAVRAKFRPVQQGLQNELRISHTQQGRIHDWFGNTAAEIARQKAQSQQAYAAATGQLRTDAANASTQDAANREAIGNPAGNDVGARAEASRRALADAFVATLTTQGLNASDFFGTKGIANAQGEQVAHGAEAGRAAQTRVQLRDLKSQKGDFRTTFRQQTAQDARKAQLEEAALGVKASTARTQAQIDRERIKVNADLAKAQLASSKSKDRFNRRDKKHDNRLADSKFSSDQDKLDYQKRHGLGPFKPPAKKKGTGPTRTQRIKAQTDYKRGVSLISGLPKVGGKFTDAKGKKHKVTEDLLLQTLIRKYGIHDTDIARAAVQTHLYGGAGPHTRRALKHRYHIHVPGFKQHKLTAREIAHGG